MYALKNNITGLESKDKSPQKIYGLLKKETERAGVPLVGFDSFVEQIKRSGRIKLGFGRLSIVVTWTKNAKKEKRPKTL